LQVTDQVHLCCRSFIVRKSGYRKPMHTQLLGLLLELLHSILAEEPDTGCESGQQSFHRMRLRDSHQPDFIGLPPCSPASRQYLVLDPLDVLLDDFHFVHAR
jgi:hypothetical protein